MWVAYIGIGAAWLLFFGFIFVMVVATIMDWDHQRRHSVFIKLQKDHTKPRKSAAK